MRLGMAIVKPARLNPIHPAPTRIFEHDTGTAGRGGAGAAAIHGEG
jgi:hypothetical protein